MIPDDRGAFQAQIMLNFALILQGIPTETVLLCANSAATRVVIGTQTHVGLYASARPEPPELQITFEDDQYVLQLTSSLRFSRPQHVLRLWKMFSTHLFEHLPTNSTLFSEQTFNTDLAVRWINDCEETHSCAVIGDAVWDLLVSDLLLIDVVADCLVSANPKRANS
jgi:hypothetical protein